MEDAFQQTTLVPVLLTAGVCLVIAAICVALWRRGRRSYIDGLDGTAFEEYCAELLRGAGFSHVHTTQASRDFGADILAEREGITYAVQCKRYDRPVGVSAVQEVYAARDFYGRMVGAVMTNASFTAPAREMAEKLGILLWDAEDLRERFRAD